MPTFFYLSTMTKTYKTKKVALNIVISMPNGNAHIEFKSGYINAYGLRGAYFTTDNEDIQRGIEAHEYFQNGDIYTEDIAYKEEVADKVSGVKRKNRKATTAE